MKKALAYLILSPYFIGKYTVFAVLLLVINIVMLAVGSIIYSILWAGETLGYKWSSDTESFDDLLDEIVRMWKFFYGK